MSKKGIYFRNRWTIKGKLFEAVLRKLLLKAGFSPDVLTDQLTRNLKRLHGRGATYDPDVLGQFSLGIPFVNPLLIVGEAKHYAKKVTLKEVREFLGSYVDFSQYPRVETKRSGEARYSVLYKTRFTYCPIFFSVKGFNKQAEALMFVHGINYISYENSEIIATIMEYMDTILEKLKFPKFEKNDFRLFENIDTLLEVRGEIRKSMFEESVRTLIDYLDRVDSIMGVLDRKYPIHILYKRKVSADKFKKVRIVKRKENLYIIENIALRKYGEFSLTPEFIENYIKYANKRGILERIFRQIDIISLNKGVWEMKQLIIDNASREELIQNFLPPKEEQLNLKSQ